MIMVICDFLNLVITIHYLIVVRMYVMASFFRYKAVSNTLTYIMD